MISGTTVLRLPENKTCLNCARRFNCKRFKNFKGSDQERCIWHKKERKNNGKVEFND